uniref:Protein kinase domain-containing protein n=1 Tax=Ganoderma boninense TaxID=34458 RepID=A0A5K1K6D9_9APHY|nr:Protein kinase domain-containing protein [Ganoderma boninense]
MAAGAALAVTATQLANATDYVQQLQGLLRATEAALDTANKLNATGGRCLKLFKPMLTARAHYKDALEIYSVAMKTIMPCIGDMDQAVALAFLASAMQFLNFRKTIYEGELYKRRDCIQLRREAIKLRENAEARQ